jgi:hypothetical protein
MASLLDVCYTIRVERGKEGYSMGFEQMIDRDKVEKLAGERAFLKQGLERIQCRLAQCEEKIISLTDGDDTDRCAAIRLANGIPTQALKSMVVILASRKSELEAILSILLPEQARKSAIEIKECAERIEIYCQVFRSRELGISR